MVDLYILGSKSPDRAAMMANAGLVPFTVVPGDYPETDEASDPVRLAGLLARKKGENVLRKVTVAVKDHALEAPPDVLAKRDAEVVVITADTLVSFKSETIGKAANEFEAFAILSKLQGNVHKLVTAYHLIVLRVDFPAGTVAETASTTGTSITKVKFAPLTQAEIRGYILTDEWRGRAGCYAIQHVASQFVSSIEGSHSGVVGLPACNIVEDLQRLGVPARPRP